MKTTLQWTEALLKNLKVIEDCDWQTITSITDLLKFHNTLLQNSAEARLAAVEAKLQTFQSDLGMMKMSKR